MALSAGDLVLTYTDIIRGLEADLARAEILGVADTYQKQRAEEIIPAQMAAAQAALSDAQEKAAAEANDTLHAFVEANAPADGFDDSYSKLKKADFQPEFAQRGLVYDDADTIPVLIDKLRAYDLHHAGVAVAAGVTPGA